MRYRASVTFEFLTEPPETVRTEIVAGKPETGAHRALREARRQLPNRRPCSIVVVLELERDPAAEASASQAA
jgi:hypothetical protein